MIKAVALSAGLALPALAWAADLPRYDVEAHCKKVASFSSPYSETIFGGCMDMEQAAYNELKASWPKLSQSVQSHCARVATFGDPGSYAIMQGCAQMELEAANKNRDRRFQY